MGMNPSQLDRLDEVAERLRAGDDWSAPLSTGERLYVALAANSAELLKSAGYSMVEALARLGDEDISELIKRWQSTGKKTKARLSGMILVFL